MQTQGRPISGPYSPGDGRRLHPHKLKHMEALLTRRERLEVGLERLHTLFLDMSKRYIDLLNQEEGDADFEPTLASPEAMAFRGQLGPVALRRRLGTGDDREEVSEDEGAQCDDEGVSGSYDPDSEPWLGATERGPGGSQNWLYVPVILDGEEDAGDAPEKTDEEGDYDSGFDPVQRGFMAAVQKRHRYLTAA